MRGANESEAAFEVGVSTLTSTAAPSLLAVVHDPAAQYRPQPGWDGHALIEGLARSAGEPKAKYRALRQRLVSLWRRRDS